MVMIGLWGYPGSMNLGGFELPAYEERLAGPFLCLLRFLRIA
jgi:hypothetical protein